MASRKRELPKEGQRTRVFNPPTMLPRYPEEYRLKSLVRSLFVLDVWIEKNEEHTDDEVRIRRIKRWREEALEELRFQLGLARR